MKKYRIFVDGPEEWASATPFYVYALNFKGARQRVFEVLKSVTGKDFEVKNGEWRKNCEGAWDFPHRRWMDDDFSVHIQHRPRRR